MKSKDKKHGKAYRYYKQRSRLHAKKGKDRAAATSKRPKTDFTYKGWSAKQNVKEQHLVVYNPAGIPFTEFMVSHKLTSTELQGYIDYCIKVSKMREGESLCD